MSDIRLVVNFAALHQASADIQRALGHLDAHLGQLERDAAPLVASWEGAAREAYDARQATWRRASGDLQAILREIKVAVDESAADYHDTERRAAGRF
ncbi:WXG100 family type VII secretion target [Phytohabitans houttuyneae]|uniref:ESAT-6-like protein n=1 Tax=Phytohabitans houttuyneae TaxID=1076126 RepID=A0A6V8K9U5_9ACTN|nr:WXG100 family type VII secretion target [Phytohabitans houttuyneae]GFJ79231.1 ESAT-6-like protein [Phytohabitans houttuyneae]